MDNNFTTTVYPENFNVTWAIKNMAKVLDRERDGDETKKEDQSGVSWLIGDGMNLRLLIHYLGDMHQPLHTVSRYTKEFPNGDMGGNLFMLQEKDNVTELHALWDSGVYEFDQDLDRPLNETAWKWLDGVSERLRKENTMDDLKDLLKKPESEWASEGYEIASKFVYDIKENSMPSEKYIEQGQKYVNHQLALGGYRLANLLIKIFEHHIAEEEKLFLQG